MSLDPRIGPNGRDDDLTRALRAVYAAPADGAYWDDLARRIMARIVDAEGDGWWTLVAGWARVGIIAAAVALAIAGVALSRSRATEAQIAYQAIIETPRSAPLQLATDANTRGDRDATLRYVISP